MNKLLAIVASILFCCCPVFAQHSFEVMIENDFFDQTDVNYTHGTLFTLYYKTAQDWINCDVTRFFLGGNAESLSHSLGQWIYTPNDTRAVPPPSDQRPYSGRLFYQPTLFNREGNVLKSLGVQVGVVGPSSYAAETQKEFHRWLDMNYPLGWDYQLEDEPIVDLVWQNKIKWFYCEYSDLFTQHGGAIGNADIFANLGVYGRIGFNIPNDFGSMGGEPTPKNLVPIPGDISLFLRGFAEVRAVGRNIALDGNTFDDDSPSVDKEPFVFDYGYGVGVGYKSLSISFDQVFRTAEYETGGGHNFGRIVVSFQW